MSLAPSIEAFSFDFKFYIFLYVLFFKPFVDHHIPSVCDVPSLPICLICNAPLCCIFVESVLQVCKSRCLAPLICVFDLHLWVLCLVLRFALHFFVHRFLHLGLAHWFTFSCTSILIMSRTSIASSPCSWNPFLPGTLSLFVYHMSCTINSFVYHLYCPFALRRWFSLSAQLTPNVYPYILHLCLLPLSCSSNTYFAPLAYMC